MLAILVISALLQAPDFSQATFSGIVITEFDTPQGKVNVYLPFDMAAGDTISGTVLVEPKGTGDEKEKNAALLKGLVVSIDGDFAEISGQSFVIRGLDKEHRLKRSVKTKVWADGPEFSAPIEVDEERTDVTPEFILPEIAPAGKPTSVSGTFDGDLSTTSVTVGGKPATVFVESPRTCVLQADAALVGKQTMSVSDAGKTGEGTVFCPRISLSADKTQLLRGESTTLTVTVEGLDGAPESLYPIPIELTNETPGVIDLPVTTSFGLEFSDVQGGTWSRDYTLTAISGGGFLVAGALFNVSLHDAKKLMTNRQFNDWVRGLIVVYEEKLKLLEAEARKQGRQVNPGLRDNIGRKRNLIRTLKTFRNVTSAGEKNIAAVAVDKALADENFFSVASVLITMAADMLGYSSLPLPGIGALLKGVKAIAQGTPRALAALNTAQSLYDQLTRIRNARAKAAKAAELKAALQKVKDALR